MKDTIDIATFQRDHSFYGDIPILFTIKSFDLLAIRKRYLASRANKQNRTGSVERRDVAPGGIAKGKLSMGKLNNYELLAKQPEPRGIAFNQDYFCFSSENTIYIFPRNKAPRIIEDPWFSYIHTLDLYEDNVLISSSGLDVIFEWHIPSQKKIWEWYAWENGFNKSIDPHSGATVYLTRNKEEAHSYERQGKAHIFIENPVKQALPTSRRAAFINSVCYNQHDDKSIIATFFHEGAVYQIDRQSGTSKKCVDQLKNPHGGRNYGNGYMATSTASGEIIITENTQKKAQKLDLTSLPGKPEELQQMEWIQNTIVYNDLVISIDSNRSAFVIIDIEKKLYDMVPFDPNFAIQDIVTGSLTKDMVAEIKKFVCTNGASA